MIRDIHLGGLGQKWEPTLPTKPRLGGAGKFSSGLDSGQEPGSKTDRDTHQPQRPWWPEAQRAAPPG